MKLRIRGNSVRIRLTRSEVARLGAGDRVEQSTRFSALSSLTSSVERSPRVGRPTVEFDNCALRVLLPPDQVNQWAHSDQVTIDGMQTTGEEAPLQILVEKDFECVHARAEGDSDAFPNPREWNACSGATVSTNS